MLGRLSSFSGPLSKVFNTGESYPEGMFVTKWFTNTIVLPIYDGGNYNFTVDWGDGNTNVITSWNDPNATHNYLTTELRTIKITGTIDGWSFGQTGDGGTSGLRQIVRWGTLKFGNLGNNFLECFELLSITCTDLPDLSGIYNLAGLFSSCGNLSLINRINDWDVSEITSMNGMFYGTQFNQNISSWNVENVTDMENMFRLSLFNQNISSWNVSNVTNMSYMFSDSPFNHNISSWNVSKVSEMTNMFNGSDFNQPIGSWDVSNVTNMAGMFAGTPFNQNISGWNVSGATNMAFMFGSSSFNQSINSWDVSSVTDMNSMFYDSDFNQSLSSWDVSSVNNMSYMFYASSFNQDVSSWNIANVTNMIQMFAGSSFSTSNYDSFLNAWASIPFLNVVQLGMGSIKYSSSGEASRQILISTYGWTITDGGLKSLPVTTDSLQFFIDISDPLCYTIGSTTINDISGNGYIGTLFNGVTYDPANDGSLSFFNNYCSTTYLQPSFDSSSSFSWYIWVYPRTVGFQPIIGNRNSYFVSPTRFIKLTGNTLEFFPETGGQTNFGQPMTAFVWQNICFVKNGSNLLYYKNGIQVSQQTNSGQTSTTNPFFLGGDINANELSDCKIAVVAVYHKALSPQEVSDNYDSLKSRFGL